MTVFSCKSYLYVIYVWYVILYLVYTSRVSYRCIFTVNTGIKIKHPESRVVAAVLVTPTGLFSAYISKIIPSIVLVFNRYSYHTAVRN